RSVKPRPRFPSLPLFPKLVDSLCSQPLDLLLTRPGFIISKFSSASSI
ncbi:hypothetical protein Gohar_022854, partial [Gossypium harknessii]|nr:hypothetical protein [Gossypium harknessii]